jgi:type VI secretion system protein ImpC
MDYQVSFGTLGKPAATVATGTKFRLAVLGDFSGRANAGTLATGAALGAARPLKVDVDNLDDVIARLKLKLNLDLTGDGQSVAVSIGSIDDFHPDQLAENLEFFGELTSLRKNLGSKAGFDRAAKEVLSWGGEVPLPPPPRQARGATIAKDCKLSDFARLTGRKPVVQAGTEADDLVRRLVGPFVQPARDSRQDQLIARVDEALSAAMRRVLHHPDFQAMEAIWRGVEFLVRRIETGAKLEIVLYDVSAEELAADLAATDSLEETGLYTLLAEAPLQDAQQGPISAVLGLYGFELSPPHADLLGRIAKITAGAGAPFVAAIAPDALATPFHDQHPLIKDAWTALQGLQEAAYLGLATPRFLLRMPYGRKSDPIDAFAFEEFTRQSGLSGMLWGHPALLAGLLVAETFKRQGAKMSLGSIATAGDMPYYVYTDQDGDQTALPCTERLYSERQAAQVSTYNVIPVLSLRGRPEVRLGGFKALAGGTLAGFWAPVVIKPAPAAPASPPTPAQAEVAQAPEPTPEAAAPAAPNPDLDALDALLAGLEAPAAAPEPAAAEEAAPADAMNELDALLASLSAEPPPAAPDATESDLDALLASLK